jgi:hypothetical protein
MQGEEIEVSNELTQLKDRERVLASTPPVIVPSPGSTAAQLENLYLSQNPVETMKTLPPPPAPTVIFPICAGCNQPIRDSGITAMDKPWHQSCFICGHCRKPLAGLPFLVYNNIPYCEQDFGTLFVTQQCQGCKQPIVGPYIRAMNALWHKEHFVCARCSNSLESGFWETQGNFLNSTLLFIYFFISKLSLKNSFFVEIGKPLCQLCFSAASLQSQPQPQP